MVLKGLIDMLIRISVEPGCVRMHLKGCGDGAISRIDDGFATLGP